jgi:hypothetical protein
MASPWVMAMNEPAVMRVGTQDVYFVTTRRWTRRAQILQTW